MTKTKTKRQTALLCAVAALFIASSCAARTNKRGSAESEAILPQIDVIRVKESADEALRIAGDLKRENEALNAKITEFDNRLILLSEEVSNVSTAKIEELETRLALLTEAYKEMFVKQHALEIAIRPVPKPTPPPPNRSTFTTTSDGFIVASPEYEMFQTGLRLFNNRSYEKSLAMFTDCLGKFPDGEYRDRVQYWIGECNYQLKRMEQAIEAYKKVFTYQNSSKSDAAQFQIALAYQKMGQTEKARAEFRRLVERYPASSYVERAKKYISELK
ncbi:MAG: tetratricopeptide repeat protein [Chitinispirillales bacterium]|jgi:TolA-binding protein|nr:tetratricopeptide repeat protein [Chitinispirillales bacterium]